MVLNNIKNRQKGFTIVELLVVIVVIGILAAITIVSYTGVTARANSTKAQTNAAAVVKVAEVLYAETNMYPADKLDANPYTNTSNLLSAWTGAPVAYTGNVGTNSPTTAKVPSGVSIIAGQARTAGVEQGASVLNDTNGANTVSWSCLTDCTNAVTAGGRIGYWNFTTKATEYLYVGQANSSSTTFTVPNNAT